VSVFRTPISAPAPAALRAALRHPPTSSRSRRRARTPSSASPTGPVAALVLGLGRARSGVAGAPERSSSVAEQLLRAWLRSPARNHQGGPLHPLRERQADAPQANSTIPHGSPRPAAWRRLARPPPRRRRRAWVALAWGWCTAGIASTGSTADAHHSTLWLNHPARADDRRDLDEMISCLLEALVPRPPYRSRRIHPYTEHGHQSDVSRRPAGGVEVWECGIAHPGGAPSRPPARRVTRAWPWAGPLTAMLMLSRASPDHPALLRSPDPRPSAAQNS